MESSSTNKTIVLKNNHHHQNHHRPKNDLLYTIDVLTDGSEGTGDGTLFLSVWNKKNIIINNAGGDVDSSNDHHGSSNNNDNDNEWYTTAPVARYCLSGAMNADATSRLAADQRFKLGTTLRAIFCVSSQQQQDSCCSWWGITPLHLALRKAGAASVHIIVADPPPSPSCRATTSSRDHDNKITRQDDASDDTLEKVIALTEGGGGGIGRLYPVVHICKVPQLDESSSSSSPWWKVYQDEYILVHSRRMTINNNNNNATSSSSSDNVLFLYTLVSHQQQQVATKSRINGKEASSCYYFTSFLMSSPHDCSLQDLEKIMCQLLVKNQKSNNTNNNNSSMLLQLPVVTSNELRVHHDNNNHLEHDETNVSNNNNNNNNDNNNANEIPIQCRFAIGLRPSTSTSNKAQNNGLEMNKPSSSDCSSSDDDDDDDDSSDESCSSSSSSSSSVNDNAHGHDAVYWTQPSLTADPFLLARARQQGIEWNKELPEYFSWNNHHHHHCHSSDDDNNNSNTTETMSCCRRRQRGRLQTGTSLAFTANQDETPFIVNRMAKIIRCTTNQSSNNNVDNNGDSSSSLFKRSDNGLPRQKWPHKLLDFLKSPSAAAANGSSAYPLLRTEVDDENEIDLDDDDDADDDDDNQEKSGVMKSSSDKSFNNNRERHVVKLLVLGTGCASPSAYRGASGYALLFPKMALTVAATAAAARNNHHHPEWAMVIEAGEGFVAQWHRHATLNIAKIRFIWVSHAHWDHYGGLAPLLMAIAKETQYSHPHLYDDENDETKSMQVGQQRKKARRDTSTAHTCTSSSLLLSSCPADESLDYDPPWVMAPRKVLKFLELTLPPVTSNNGQCRRSYYRGVPMDEHNNNGTYRRRASDHCPADAFDDLNNNYGRPITFWENIQVDHCKSSFGFVAGLRHNANVESTAMLGTNGYNDDDPFIFAFSGDTRPCQRFVRVCQARVYSRCHACGDNFPHDDNHVHFLLHEATFDEEEQEMAIAKKHSTIREALQVAQNVKAERVLLTHFSQRYNNDSLFSNTDITTNDKDTTTNSSAPYTPKVGVALDGMLVPLYSYQLI